MGIDANMHPVTLFANSTCCDQVGTQRIVLGQISSEIHLLPLELLAKVFLAREPKLAQMPSLDEVDLAVCWGSVDLIWMRLRASSD